MRKKQLLERKAALVKENGEHLARVNAGGEGIDLTVELAAINTRETEITGLDEQLKSIDELEKLTRANAARSAAEPQASVIRDNAAERPWGLGEFMQAVRVAAMQPSSIDPRLQKLALGANEKVGVEGGFLVGTDVGMLDSLTHNVGILAPMCSEVPISSGANGTVLYGVDETSRADGSRFGGVQAYWADEAATVTTSKPKWRRIEMRLNKLMALFYATDEVLSDASVLASEATRAFTEEMSFKLDDAIVRGTGSGQPIGILNAPVTVSVAKETAQTAATIVFENLVKMWARMPARSKSSATWFVNDDTLPQIQLMTMGIGTAGVPVYLPPGGASAAPYGTVFGRPVVPIEQCATLGTVGDIVLADMSQYKLATKGGIQQAASIHVAFLTAEQVFRFMYRVDGQPARSTPMTPFKGTATLSPFVTLATRS